MTDGSTYETPEDVWLLNLGYISDHSEQNLMLYGYVSNPGVLNVELMIDVEQKHVRYAIVLNQRSHFRYKAQGWLESKSGLLAKLALLCFLRMFGSYDPAARIAQCIRDYAGAAWSTSTEVLSVSEYKQIVDSSGTTGWVFKDRLDKGAGAPGQDRPSTPAAPSR